MTEPVQPTPGAPAAPPTPNTPPAPAPAPPATTPPSAVPPWERDGQQFDPQRAWDLVQSLRTENTTLKQSRNQQDAAARTQLADVAKLLGLAPETNDPAALTEQIEAAQDAAWRSGVQLALYKAAGQLGANADALLDSMSFIESLDAIDAEPGDPEFATQLADLVKAAVERNPTFKSGQAPAAPTQRFPAGADGGARSGTSVPQLSESDLTRMSPEQIVEAQEKGQLNNLLGIK